MTVCRWDQCNRTARRESPYCNTHFLALLTAAYATPRTATGMEEARGRFPPSAASSLPVAARTFAPASALAGSRTTVRAVATE